MICLCELHFDYFLFIIYIIFIYPRLKLLKYNFKLRKTEIIRNTIILNDQVKWEIWVFEQIWDFLVEVKVYKKLATILNLYLQIISFSYLEIQTLIAAFEWVIMSEFSILTQKMILFFSLQSVFSLLKMPLMLYLDIFNFSIDQLLLNSSLLKVFWKDVLDVCSKHDFQDAENNLPQYPNLLHYQLITFLYISFLMISQYFALLLYHQVPKKLLLNCFLLPNFIFKYLRLFPIRLLAFLLNQMRSIEILLLS